MKVKAAFEGGAFSEVLGVVGLVEGVVLSEGIDGEDDVLAEEALVACLLWMLDANINGLPEGAAFCVPNEKSDVASCGPPPGKRSIQ